MPLVLHFCLFGVIVFALIEVKNMSFDHNKTAPKKRKKQLPAKEMGEERRSTLSIRYGLSSAFKAILFHTFILYTLFNHATSRSNKKLV